MGFRRILTSPACQSPARLLRTVSVVFIALTSCFVANAQSPAAAPPQETPPIAQQPAPAQQAPASEPAPSEEKSGAAAKAVGYLTNYLNMAGAHTARDFKPMTQPERNRLYFKNMTNPIMFFKAAFSGAIDQANNKPQEWGQGAEGYGKRFANILGQYSIQKTTSFGLGSLLHEDNRYFNSGKTGFWPRTGYALESSMLARHDDGSRHISISQIGGVAAGAFISRLWQPPSHSSAGDGAVSFGITMASNTGFSVVKEFLPDLGRALARKYGHKPPPPATPQPHP